MMQVVKNLFSAALFLLKWLLAIYGLVLVCITLYMALKLLGLV